MFNYRVTCGCFWSEQAEREKEHDRFLDQQHQLTSTGQTVKDRASEQQNIGVFCGCVEIHLHSTVQHTGLDSSGQGHANTAARARGAASGRGFLATGGMQDGEFVCWYPLTRRDGAQAVSGEMQVSVSCLLLHGFAMES